MNSKYLINTAVREYPDNLAFIGHSKRLTFKQLGDRANRLANALLDLGIKKGDRAGILLRNCAAYVETDLALSKTGIVRVALNYRLGVQDHEYVLNDSGSNVLIFGEDFAADIESMKGRLNSVEKFICVSQKSRQPRDADTFDYEQIVAAGSADDPPIEIADDDLHALVYTSGTTGNPKGVMITEKAWVSATINIVLNYGPITQKDIILNLQQLSHGAGYFVLPFFIKGATNAIVEFEPSRVFRTIEQLRVTVLKLVPVMLYKLLDAPDKHQYDLSSLNHIIYGGSPISRQRLAEALGFFGQKFSQLYGQAEIPMCISTLSREDHLLQGSDEELKRLESAGKPCLNVELKVIDDSGHEAGPGQMGEVIARGGHVMKGYWKLPEATSQALKDGWIYTGDIGYRDSKGFLFLVDRKKDMIISGAFNIYPAEIEKILIKHPAVQEVAVIGVPDEKWGEAVKAAVVLQPGAKATQKDLLDYCKQSGAGFRTPKTIDFINEIPRNPYGKVDKKSLRQPYWERLAKSIH
jgi:acyl-CoA synthetase (AMP-forming)/AMP-acid ligase II